MNPRKVDIQPCGCRIYYVLQTGSGLKESVWMRHKYLSCEHRPTVKEVMFEKELTLLLDKLMKDRDEEIIPVKREVLIELIRNYANIGKTKSEKV